MSALRGYPHQGTSAEKVRRFLIEQAHRGVAASTQNQALNALVFFYEKVLETPLGPIDAARVKRPARVRTALSIEDTRRLLERVEDVGAYPTRLIAWLIYGCGLRVAEPLELRLKDVDLPGGRAAIRGAKGGKDRLVDLPVMLREGIAAQVRLAQAVWRADVAAGRPISLPRLQARKSPRLAFSEAWAWLFPAHKPSRNPRSGLEERWRMHEVNVQRAVRAAAAAAELSGQVTPHSLRHCYATHAHLQGATPRELQVALGHSHLDTTMRYLSPGRGIPSPADRLHDRLPAPCAGAAAVGISG